MLDIYVWFLTVPILVIATMFAIAFWAALVYGIVSIIEALYEKIGGRTKDNDIIY